MRRILILLSVVYTVILSLNFIIGTLTTPPGFLFLAPVHHPNDYYYYLSQFAQGKSSWFTSIDMYTSEKTKPTLVGATNVFAGHIASWFSIPPIYTYQITLTVYTFLFFLLVVLFLEQVFPKKKEARLIAFILFFIANLAPGRGTFFANVTEPLVRFPRVPHQMLGHICIMTTILIILKWQGKLLSLNTKIIFGILVACASITLANINPVQWILITCVLFISRFGIIPIIFLLTGAPMVYYLTRVFTTPPFTQIALWESWQVISMTPVRFIESFGPIIILAILGLPIFLKQRSLPKLLITIYVLSSLSLFLSPIARMAHITNVRFLSAITVLGESILATYLLVHIPIARPIMRRIAMWCIVGAIAAYLIPVFVRQYVNAANLNVLNSYIYLSPDAAQVYRQAQKMMTAKDIALVTWPFDSSFPAITGIKGYMGHPLLTLNATEKNQLAYDFFDARVSDEAMHAFLIDNGITYVVQFTSVTKIIKPFLTVAYQTPTLTIYKVLP